MSIKTAVAQANRKMAYLLSALIILLTIMPVPLLRAMPLATDVGGPIVSNTTWTLANSPYIVIANVEVWDDVTLTIEPGVVVKFNSGKLLQVNGTLVARGTANQPITFTSNQPNPQPGNWGGIVFADSSMDAIFDANGNYLSGSILQYCIVEYGGNNVDSAVDAPTAAPFIDHCTIQNNASRGIQVYGTSVNPAMISHSVVSSNSSNNFGAGIAAQYSIIRDSIISGNSTKFPWPYGRGDGGGIYARYSTVSNNTISGNSASYGGGIRAEYSTVINNTIGNNTTTSIYGGVGIYAEYSTISNNIISGNSATYGDGGGIYTVNSTVSNNTVMNNSTVYGSGVYARSGTVVISNTITGNSASGSGGGIYASYSIVSNNTIGGNLALFDGGGIYAVNSPVSNNTVDSNSASNKGGGIYATGEFSYDDVRPVLTNTVTGNTVTDGGQGVGVYLRTKGPNEVNIAGNTIVGNTGPVTQTVGGVALETGLGWGEPNVQLHYNNLYGNSPYDVVMLSSSDISSTNNYWGTTANVDILAQVYDFYDDSSRGRLLYIPYLQQPSPDAPVPPPLNLQAGLNGTSATLSWQALPSATTGYGYKVYYGPNSVPPYNGSGLPQGNSPIDVNNQTQLTLTGLSQGQTYYFTVTAYDTQGRESWYSNVASATPPPPGPPAAPGNLQATAVDATHIQLNWQDNSTDETGFRIKEGVTQVATVTTNIISYTVGSLAPNSSHCYRLFAFNNYGEAGSNQACATTLPAPTYTVSGQVTNQNGNPIAGVTLSDGMGHTTTTSTSGNYTLSGLVAGTYTITPTKNNYRFSPASLSVSVPPSKTGQNFTGKLCKSPYTGIDICQLQKGDILLAFGQLGSIPQVARMIAGTYWFHGAVWVDDQTNFEGKLLAHATGPSTYVSNADQVKTQSVYETYWWTGTGLYDWAVIRPLTTNAIKTQATTYARSKADQQDPDILYNITFLDKNREDRFYCSQLVWKAYQKQGLDLEADKGLVNAVVTPDDLYYSLYDQAVLVQAKGTPLDRVVFRLHSPANMLLVNPVGKRVGFDPATQQIVNEIPGTYYIGPNDEPEALSVGVPDISGWKLIVTGTGNGSYALDAEVIDPSAPISQTVTLTTSPGQVDTFYIADPNTSGGQLIKKVQPVFLPLVVK